MPQQELFSAAPEAGHIVQGKYRLARILSEGGGGVVWEAFDPSGRQVALKFLKWNPAKTREAVADRFKNEFAILKSLAHPNIGQIYDFGLDPGSGLYFFTSELLMAGDLTRLLLAPVPLLEELLLQSLRALEYLRGHKLLHLDIKPHNLLLRQSGESPVLALIDFGLATFRPPDRPGGTPNYMAPELISMRLCDVSRTRFPPPDHRSDLYSLGVTFYHCLTGRAPFNVAGPDGKKDAMATLRRHFELAPPPPSSLRPEVPAYLDRIIMKLMAHHPDERYPSAIVAAQALQYSSPTMQNPECMQTLLAYLPKEGRLVGRREECAIIEQSLRAIADGVRHAAPIVIVHGGRGSGRSRMLAFAKPLAQQMEMDATFVAEGQDLPPSLIQSLESGEGSAAVRAVMIDDIDRFMMNEQGDSLDDAGAQAVRALIRRLRLQQRLPAASAPRMILIASLDAERMGLAQAFEDLNIDHALCHCVELANFTRADIAEYLEALLGERPDRAVIDQLAHCTGGNPLFLTEHLEQMISQGRLFSLAGRPDAATLKAIGVDFSKAPPSRSLAESILEKLRMLNDEARDAALAMACWQRPVSLEELSATCERGSADRAVLMLMEARLAHNQRHDGRIEFTNEMAGRVIREAATRAECESCHDRIAGHLIARFVGGRRRGRREIDLHVAYGSASPERIPALRRLIEAAAESGRPLDAAEHLHLLLDLLPEGEAAGRAAALAELGSAYERAHRIADARSAFAAIRDLRAPSPLRERLRVEAAERLGLLAMRRRDLRDARRLFSEALSFLSGDADPAAKIRLENYIASVDLREGNIERAVERFERSSKVAENILTPDEKRAVTNNELGEALLALGKPSDAVGILRKELALAEAAGDEQKSASRHYLLGNALRNDEIMKPDEARDHYEKGLAIARQHRLVEMQVRLQNGLGNLMLKVGRPKEALAHYQEGLKLAQQIEGETTGVEIMIGMGLASQQMASPENTIEYFEAALDFSGAPKGKAAGLIRRYRPTIYISLGDAYLQRHDLGHAEDYLKKALAMDRKKALTPDIRYSLYGTFAELALERGDRDAARRYMPTIEAIAKSFPQAQGHLKRLKQRLG
ncbi:MAG: tetratricopeptide repeat protein [Proteobacteria bacterium]|nr:tetratricopeptide repeat protein [Pseudomonadota bacterium]